MRHECFCEKQESHPGPPARRPRRRAAHSRLCRSLAGQADIVGLWHEAMMSARSRLAPISGTLCRTQSPPSRQSTAARGLPEFNALSCGRWRRFLAPCRLTVPFARHGSNSSLTPAADPRRLLPNDACPSVAAVFLRHVDRRFHRVAGVSAVRVLLHLPLHWLPPSQLEGVQERLRRCGSATLPCSRSRQLVPPSGHRVQGTGWPPRRR